MSLKSVSVFFFKCQKLENVLKKRYGPSREKEKTEKYF